MNSTPGVGTVRSRSMVTGTGLQGRLIAEPAHQLASVYGFFGVRMSQWRAVKARQVFFALPVTIFLSGAGCRPMPGAHRRSPGSGPPP